jgi:hypothetical protein
MREMRIWRNATRKTNSGGVRPLVGGEDKDEKEREGERRKLK